MQGQQFEIHIRSNSSTAEEWKRAMEASVEELKKHPLNEWQKETAKRFGIPEEEYARGELAGVYGRQRLESTGQNLGRIIERLLAEVGDEYHLQALLYEGTKSRWIARVESSLGTRNLSIQRDLVDDVVDSELYESIQELKRRLVAGLVEKSSGTE
jgi:hypothetical protein